MTAPEIEMLIICNEGKYAEYKKEKGKNPNLKPNIYWIFIPPGTGIADESQKNILRDVIGVCFVSCHVEAAKEWVIYMGFAAIRIEYMRLYIAGWYR